ncbi:PaaI family thioesterase [Rhodovulum adriaticum]|uniref:Uncharacterized protein (TIGR00369 family) n=1 Tax=Rhodovulum adriaticum TaxID=35804 RepID=A0A4R2NMB0_RHOAD|nr:PaaI family thioesterase [Rhodovulum adriaticum]MBK1636947.1 phenylacetic acid degradation protein [Rhodovulum adriaticum]TCP22747.1 uncharacterized protein (TIGR00369 family) [Rhodovulum adriaticum]
MQFEPRNPDYARTVNDSFAAQGMMQSLGAAITALAPGQAEITAPLNPAFGQQQGYAHAGFTFSLADTAAGYAALSLLPPGHEVLSSEMKLHLLAPGRGQRLIARGEVVKPGRRLVIVRADVWAEDGENRTHTATLLGTIVPVPL